MIFVWDENKNRSNRRKHGVSFEAASGVFQDRDAVSYPDCFVEGEQRWHTIGLIDGVLMLLVVHTQSGISIHSIGEGKANPNVKSPNQESTQFSGEAEEIRIISARKANPRERAIYYSAHS
jgi:uncharacterized DUF497 family protein